jgi:hypothetical protein
MGTTSGANHFKVNDGDVSSFSTKLAGVYSDMKSNAALQAPAAGGGSTGHVLGPSTGSSLSFGQPVFRAASLLSGDYNTAYLAFSANLAALLSAVDAVAGTAKTIGANYKAASDQDVVGVQSVDSLLNTPPASG